MRFCRSGSRPLAAAADSCCITCRGLFPSSGWLRAACWGSCWQLRRVSPCFCSAVARLSFVPMVNFLFCAAALLPVCGRLLRTLILAAGRSSRQRLGSVPAPPTCRPRRRSRRVQGPFRPPPEPCRCWRMSPHSRPVSSVGLARPGLRLRRLCRGIRACAYWLLGEWFLDSHPIRETLLSYLRDSIDLYGFVGHRKRVLTTVTGLSTRIPRKFGGFDAADISQLSSGDF